jgi:hypothetical protein
VKGWRRHANLFNANNVAREERRKRWKLARIKTTPIMSEMKKTWDIILVTEVVVLILGIDS